ncbi:MAG: hypothetical protein ACI3V2_09860 [Faecousia sp.]
MKFFVRLTHKTMNENTAKQHPIADPCFVQRSAQLIEKIKLPHIISAKVRGRIAATAMLLNLKFCKATSLAERRARRLGVPSAKRQTVQTNGIVRSW